MNCMQFNETDQQVKLEFKDVSYFSSGEGGTPDHSKLINRDAADQHPMSAITGLEDALDSKQPTGNYLTEELDPTVPEWAKQPQKPAYTAQEVGALPDTTHIPSTAADVNAEPSGAVAQHNVSDAAHSDIRLLIQGLSERLSAVADSDDATLDQLSEVVAYIKSNRDLISAITTSKVNVVDIVDNLTTNVANKPLSAAQGVALKAIIDALTIPTALSDLTEDTTHRVVTDAEKAVWNAKSNFTGSYNDLTDKPTIPEAYTLPIASPTVLGGVQPVAKTDAMTQSVGVDANGGLWTAEASGGGSGGNSATKLYELTLTEEVKSISEGSLPFNPMEYKRIIIIGDLVSSINNTSSVSIHIDLGGLGMWLPSFLGYKAKQHFSIRFEYDISDGLVLLVARSGSGLSNLDTTNANFNPVRYNQIYSDIGSNFGVSTQNKYLGIGTSFQIWGVK